LRSRRCLARRSSTCRLHFDGRTEHAVALIACKVLLTVNATIIFAFARTVTDQLQTSKYTWTEVHRPKMAQDTNVSHLVDLCNDLVTNVNFGGSFRRRRR
jgi:hypothetical protein